MSGDNTLRRRLTKTFVLLAVVLGSVSGIGGYLVVKKIERDVLRARLEYAAPRPGEISSGTIPPSAPTKVTVAIGDRIPREVRALPPGIHEVETGDRVLNVLVGEREGQRFAVIEDITEFDEVEVVAFTGLALSLVAGVLLSLALARASANRVIAPLTRLAAAVEQDDVSAQAGLLESSDEIGQLARAFDARTQELRALLARERLFTGDVSHELRTPLTVMMGAAELLTTRLGDRPELHAAAERIQRTSADAAVCVNALLQLARAPANREEVVVSMRDLLASEVSKCEPLIADKPVTLTLTAARDVQVRAQPDTIAVAVGNLLRNACTFTREGTVTVELRDHALVVEDTGPGIPEVVRNQLFEPLVRGDGRYAGSGLGLSIAKRMTEHLGWTISLEDPPEGGTRFVLVFSPASDQQAATRH